MRCGMRILVTGSAGHLGEALMRTLQVSEHEAVGLDIKSSAFTHRVGSITERSFVRQYVQGVDMVLHTATLHKPHVVSHTRQAFVDVNITGTLNLLEEAASAGVKSFVFTSTTSVYRHVLAPPAGEPAAWITEGVVPKPKNIYGITKLAAENLCELFAQDGGLPSIVLRTGRFFPEQDDDKAARQSYDDTNLKVNEFLNRRADIADVVSAHLRRHFPGYEAEYRRRKWSMSPTIDRVYVNERARTELGWKPVLDFGRIIEILNRFEEFRSPLAIAVGAKGYHAKKEHSDGL
jgi:nucleoside-diphosphate-sugar epimerase